MLESMLWVKVQDLLVIVHSTRPPTQQEWDRWLDRMAIRDYTNIFIVTDGASPSREQGLQSVDLWRDRRQPRFALVSPSLSVRRSLITFTEVMRRRDAGDIRTFMPCSAGEALTFLEAPLSTHDEVMGAVARLQHTIRQSEKTLQHWHFAQAMLAGQPHVLPCELSDVVDQLHAAGAIARDALGPPAVAEHFLHAATLQRTEGAYGAAAFNYFAAAQIAPERLPEDVVCVGTRLTFSEGCVIDLNGEALQRHTARSVQRARTFIENELQLRESVAAAKHMAAQHLHYDMQMAGGFAHHMRNALAPAAIHANLLQDDTMPKEDIRTSAQAVQGCLNRALAATTEILRYAGLGHELGQADKGTDVVSAVSRMAERHGKAMRDAGVTLRTFMPERALAECRSDHLDTIFNEIVVNALRAMSERCGSNDGALTIQVDVGTTVVTMAATDSGDGVSERVQAQMLEPFFTTRPAEAFGLGLAIVRKLVAICGGNTEVESLPGFGTTIVIQLPRAHGSAG